MTTRSELEKRLETVEAQIQETKQRLPAHSTKPPIMMALIALEDERDEILSQLKNMEVPDK